MRINLEKNNYRILYSKDDKCFIQLAKHKKSKYKSKSFDAWGMYKRVYLFGWVIYVRYNFKTRQG